MNKRPTTTREASAISKKQLAIRDLHWPKAEPYLWDRKAHKGFTTIPKTMPMILKIMDEMTKGGIALPPGVANKEKMACDAGTVLDMGADAYADYADNRIKVGSVVLFAKYAGAIVPGTEDRERIINDTDVYGLADEVTNG